MWILDLHLEGSEDGRVPLQTAPRTGNTTVDMPRIRERHQQTAERNALRCRVGVATARRSGGGQHGFSLIEVLLSISIIAVVIMGVLAGFFTTVTASGGVGRRAGAEAVLATMAERVASVPYRNCATASQLNTDLVSLTQIAGFTTAVVKVEYLASGSSAFGSTCTTDRGAQLVSLKVTPKVVGATPVNGQVVVRNPTVRAA